MPPNPRALPSVDAVLRALGTDGTPHALAANAARTVLAEARSGIRDGGTAPAHDDIVARVRSLLTQHLIPSLRPVINAGGVILQTNLGRAPLSERAIAAMDAIARGYSNLEYDIEAGTRGSRHDHVRELIHRVTGAEDGIIVNNNAAALSMALQVFARGSEVIISRGQAVEIGGGFRIPDVLRQSGATLVEVGTTNRTYAHDYDAAWTENTAAILRVHTSNFRVVGFTTEPTLNELATVAHHRSGLLLDDLGSGCLVDTTTYGIPHEPTIQESLAAGADLALFSGDKLLGGPQCGIIIGRAELVTRLRTHPLARSLRVDKLTIAAFIA
ncbi:MAG: L-seryl-tRNA(Sec) selenium transferase, partial [Dehalococcoidia bacterium]|nr:L-seryl-tRNA(Sec) selenium transferase [Dehalococcoidia bacterium]